MQSFFQSYSFSTPSDMLVFMPEVSAPTQDVSDDIYWRNLLMPMELLPAVSTYTDISENIAKNVAPERNSKAENPLNPCSTFIQTGPGYHICQLSNDGVCAIPLEGNSRSIREHLRKHGHRQQEGTTIFCPWQGCMKTIQYKNVARHIQSTHLHVKLRCEQCGKTLTRKGAMRKHCGKARSG
ncbi:hypothetical protein V8B97DRAFT_1177026 [Scleroderma yunnanense]